MSLYHYRSRNAEGQVINGSVVASNVQDAKKKVFQLNLVPLIVQEEAIKEKRLDEIIKYFKNLRTLVELKDILLFNQQLQIIFEVGVPLLDGLKFICQQIPNKHLKAAVTGVMAEIAEGSSLHKAMSQHPKVFDRVYTAVIKAGEETGNLSQFLGHLGEILEKRYEQRAKVKNAMFYPKLVFIGVGHVVVVMLTFVVPKFTSLYSQFGKELPFITRMVMAGSDILLGYWYLFLIGGIGAYLAYRSWADSPRGRKTLDTLKLKVPVFGTLVTEMEISSFCVLLGFMYSTGMPLIDSLKVLKETVSNTIIAAEIDMFIEKLQAGHPLSEGIRESKFFPPIVANLLSVGEEVGALDKVLVKISNYLGTQVDHKVDNLSKSLEPLLMVVVFAVIGVIAGAVFMPMWNMASLLKK